MKSKLQKELIKKIKDIKNDEDLINFLEVYVKLIKNKEKENNSSYIKSIFQGCNNLTSVKFF